MAPCLRSLDDERVGARPSRCRSLFSVGNSHPHLRARAAQLLDQRLRRTAESEGDHGGRICGKERALRLKFVVIEARLAKLNARLVSEGRQPLRISVDLCRIR